MEALVGAFNQEKALEGAFSVIVQPVVEPMDRFAALILGPAAAPRMQTNRVLVAEDLSSQSSINLHFSPSLVKISILFYISRFLRGVEVERIFL